MKKIYAFIAFFMFLGMAGNAFAAKPAVQVLTPSSSDITTNSIRVTASYKENGLNTEMMFQYSTDPGFGSGVVSIPSSFELVPTRGNGYFIKTITGLNSGTNYYIRAIATNDDGPYTDNGIVVRTNTPTAPQTPKAETLGETNVTSSSLTLNGRVNTYGQSGSYVIRYYTSSCNSLLGTAGSGVLSNSTGSQYLSANITGLASNTNYCAEFVATVNGSSYSGGKVIVKTTSSGGGTINTCKITSFYADASSVVYGGSTVIRWTTTGCTNANLNTLGGSVDLNDSKNVGPLYSNITYVLNASNSNNSDSASLSISVKPNNGGGSSSCVINNFYADDSSINYGSSTTLRWTTTGCSRASISTIGSVNVNGYKSTGSLYSTTTYTLDAWGTGLYYDYDQQRTITVTVSNNNGCGNNCGGGYNYPSCYYSGTCYWNGTSWVYYNNQQNYPSCYYTSTCYWNGSSWVYTYNNNTNSYPSCYYTGVCYCSSYTNCTYYQNGSTNPVNDNYNYNPHSPYTGGTKYITQKIPGQVNTVYIDQPFVTNPNINQPVTNNNGYYGNYDYTNELMTKYGNYNYPNTNIRNGSLLTGSAGSNGGITLLNLLIVLVIIGGIVYFVRSGQNNSTH